MKTASSLLALTLFGATLGAFSAPDVYAGPMGPSAKMAARLKKYPSSNWLGHYLPDDRYKIAGGVWKFVSTDLDTYYHMPSSALMLRQPAGRVIGFSSAAEAEEAGYRAGPSVQKMTPGLSGGGSGLSPQANQQLAKALAAMQELQSLGTQMQADGAGGARNLPLVKQRMARALVLLNEIPVKPNERRQMNSVKALLRGIIKAVDLKIAGNDALASQQALLSINLFQKSMR